MLTKEWWKICCLVCDCQKIAANPNDVTEQPNREIKRNVFLPNLSAIIICRKLKTISASPVVSTRANSCIPVELKMSTRYVVRRFIPDMFVIKITVRTTTKCLLLRFFRICKLPSALKLSSTSFIITCASICKSSFPLFLKMRLSRIKL